MPVSAVSAGSVIGGLLLSLLAAMYVSTYLEATMRADWFDDPWTSGAVLAGVAVFWIGYLWRGPRIGLGAALALASGLLIWVVATAGFGSVPTRGLAVFVATLAGAAAAGASAYGVTLGGKWVAIIALVGGLVVGAWSILGAFGGRKASEVGVALSAILLSMFQLAAVWRAGRHLPPP